MTTSEAPIVKRNADTLLSDEIAEQVLFFNKLSGAEAIFDSFRQTLPERTLVEAKVVGSLWYHLSEAIVDILCIAMSKLKSPFIRHLVVQTLYEELGEGNPDELHTELLRDMLHVARVEDADILRWSGHEQLNQEIQELKADLEACASDAEISGILLGMELIAYQNVDNVIDYLGSSDPVRAAVRETPWARLHHQLEEGHIRRAVSVFVEHVPNLREQRDFIRTFMRTIRFWERFWGEIAEEARCAKLAEVPGGGA